MAFFDRLVGDPRMREVQRQRARGEGTMASQNYAQQRSANAGVAGATAARLADRGAANPALAGRVAAGQQAQMDAAAGQMFAQQQTAERQRAEAQLADMRAQRQGFFRNMLGAGLRTGSAMLGTYIGGPVGGALGGQVGNAAAGAIGAGPAGGSPVVMGTNGPVQGATGQGLNAGNMGNAPGGAGDGLLFAQQPPIRVVNPEANFSVPMSPEQQAAAAQAQTGRMVDQAMAGAPQGVPALAEGVVDTYGAGLTDDEYLQWLMANRGGV